MHDAARTIILQSHAATAAPVHAGVTFQAWLVTMLVPMWIAVRFLTRSWAAAIDLGGRHRRSRQPGHDVVEERAGVVC